MPGKDLDPFSGEQQLQQLREAADAILELRESFLELLMVSDTEFERSVNIETYRCIGQAIR